jgi:hypothetical protein
MELLRYFYSCIFTISGLIPDGLIFFAVTWFTEDARLISNTISNKIDLNFRRKAMKVRHRRSFRPDPMLYLVVFVVISMLVTTYVQADPDPYQVSQVYSGNTLLIKRFPQRPPENGWLIPVGVRAKLRGGMYHFQFSGNDRKLMSSWVPENTRVTLSIGNTAGWGTVDRISSQSLEEQYGNTFLMSVDHRW